MKAFEATRISEFDDTTCSEPNCPRLVWANGLCNVHNRVRQRPRKPNPLAKWRPYHATAGSPRCAPVYLSSGLSSGTRIVPEFQEFLDELGISYRQWDYWKRMGYLPRKHWWEIANDPTLRTRAEDLADASRLKAMSLSEIADWLAKGREAYDAL